MLTRPYQGFGDPLRYWLIHTCILGSGSLFCRLPGDSPVVTAKSGTPSPSTSARATPQIKVNSLKGRFVPCNWVHSAFPFPRKTNRPYRLVTDWLLPATKSKWPSPSKSPNAKAVAPPFIEDCKGGVGCQAPSLVCKYISGPVRIFATAISGRPSSLTSPTASPR